MSTSSVPQVTVIMPCFNAEGTIRQSIDSIRSQTCENWQLVVVDDGSTDNSPRLVEEMIAADARISLLRQINQGPSTARNRGVALSTSPFVAFLDSDDVWAPRHLELTLIEMQRDTGLGLTFAPCKILSWEGEPTGACTKAWPHTVTLEDVLACNPTSTCSSIVARRSVFQHAGLMRSDMVHAEDQEWLFRVVLSGWSVRGITEPTVGYRTNPKGLSVDIGRMFEGWQTFVGHARKHAPGVVERALPRALAHINLYYARRRLRAGESGPEVREHVFNAVQAYPRIILERPAAVIAATAGVSLSPQLANVLVETSRRLRHA